MKSAPEQDETDSLLERAACGDESARATLLLQHRGRLLKMVSVRMDARLRVRSDPSDLVQEVLYEANEHLNDFVRERPVPFHVWLREIAWKRLMDLKRRHIGSARRSLLREAPRAFDLPVESSVALVDRLISRGPSPSAQAQVNERRALVRAALESLPPLDREILVLRYLEQLSPTVIGEILGMKRGAVSTRHTRALARLRELLDNREEA
jgi:RNA polymerase sigma-70 factor, ECF subfamily